MRMPRRPALISGVLALLLAALGACTREPEPEPAPGPDSTAVAPPDAAEAPGPFPEFARRATAVELALDDYRRAEGTWQTTGAASTFTAYLDGADLRLIEEERSDEEAGEARTVFYFDGGFPFYIVEDAGPVRTRVAFGPEGEVVAAERTASGETAEVPTAEIAALWRHALALRSETPAPDPL